VRSKPEPNVIRVVLETSGRKRLYLEALSQIFGQQEAKVSQQSV
jgi:hypothetical protein